MMTLTATNFARKVGDGVPTLVGFWSQGCEASRVMAPRMAVVAKWYRVGLVCIDGATEAVLAKDHDVESVPAAVVFKHGKVARRLYGLQTTGQLLQVMSEVEDESDAQAE